MWYFSRSIDGTRDREVELNISLDVRDSSFCIFLASFNGAIMGRDRISSLADDVLVHIISLLKTQDAIRTGALSKRWKLLWLRSPCIRLDETEFRDALRRGNMFPFQLNDVQDEDSLELKWRFVSAVDVVLLSHVAPVLEVFHISFCDSFGFVDYVNHWICFTTMRKQVAKLTIKFPPDMDLRFSMSGLSFHLCPCGSITYLELCGCSIQPIFTCSEGFTSIKTLIIRSCSIIPDLIADIFMVCPSLRSCTLEDCNFLGDLSFSAPWLKYLRVSEPQDVGHKLEISAPNLVYLDIPYWQDSKVLLHGMQSLSSVKLDDISAVRFLHENVAELGRVKKLHCISDFVFDARVVNARVVNQLASLEHLVLEEFNFYDVKGLAALLVEAPKMQKLTLDGPGTDEEYFQWHLEECLSYDESCCESLKNLKQIRVNGLVDEMVHLKFVECFLKNASALESLELELKLDYEDVSSQISFESKVLALPRGGTLKFASIELL